MWREIKVAIYKVKDNETGNIFRINKQGEFTEFDFLDAKKRETERAYSDVVTSDNYRKQGMYDEISLPTEEAQKQLQRGLALLLNTNVNNVNVSESPLGHFERLGLGLRSDADEKVQALKQEYATRTNPDPVKIVVIDNQPRLMLEQRDENDQPIYNLIDEEGFSFGDLSDFSREIIPTIASVIASVGAAKFTGGTSLALGYAQIGKLALAGGIGYGLSKQAQDMAVKGFDDILKQNDFNLKEYAKYSGRQAVQNAKESALVTAVDAVTMKTLGLVTSRFGKGGSPASQNLREAGERLMLKYSDSMSEGSNINILRPTATGGERVAKKERTALLSSKLIQNAYARNADSVNEILNILKTGDPNLLEQAIQNAAKNLDTEKVLAKEAIDNVDNQLHQAIDLAYQDLARRNGVNGLFDGNTAFEPVRLSFLKNQRLATNSKNKAYREFHRLAREQGTAFDGADIITSMKRTLAKFKGGTTENFQNDFVAILNSNIKTNLRKVDDLSEGVVNRGTVKLNTRQLQKMIESFDQKAGYGLKSNQKSPDQVLAEMLASTLRKTRDKSFISKNRPINDAGKALVEANSIYNDLYLPYLRVAKGHVQQTKLGSTVANKQYLYQGNQVLDDVLSLGDDGITDFLSRFGAGAERDSALQVLRSRFLQRNGFDGNIHIGAGKKLRFDTESVRALYGERLPNGKLIRSSKNEELLKSKLFAFERLNKISGTKIIELDELAVEKLFLGSDKAQVKGVSDELANLVNVKKQNADILENNILEITQKGELAKSPDAYVKVLLGSKNTAQVKEVMRIVKELPEELQDSIRTSYIDELLRLSSPEGKGAITSTSGDLPIADGNKLLEYLSKNTTTGTNSRIVLGNDIVSDLTDSARILRYSFDPKGAPSPLTSGGVITTNGITWVAGGVAQSLGRKLYGVSATQGWLRPLLTKSSTEEMIYRQKSLFPYVMTTSKTLHNFAANYSTNPMLAKEWGMEMIKIKNSVDKEQQEIAQEQNQPVPMQ